MKNRYHVYGLFFYFLFLLKISALAQNDQLRFERLTINDGLSLSSVYSIYQDSKGFMWFGTEDGLNKYDGQRFRIFRPEPGNPYSLANKWTEIIYEDSKAQIWFGSKGGLTRFDPKLEIFSRYTSKEMLHKLSGDTISYLVEDGNKKLWVGTSSGINMIDLVTNQVQFKDLMEIQIFNINPLPNGDIWVGTSKGIFIKKAGDASFLSINVDNPGYSKSNGMAILHDNNGNIWAGVGNILFRYDQIKNLLINQCTIGTETFGNHNVQIEKMVMDNQQNLWLSTSDGLYKFSTQSGKINSIFKTDDVSHSLANNSIKSILLDKQGNLWYGTFEEGIYRIDTKTNAYVNFRNNPADPQSLSENGINCIFEDLAGKIWFGTFGAGISIYNPSGHKFGLIGYNPLNKYSLSSNFIWNIWETNDDFLLIGTNDKGLNMLDLNSGKVEFFDHEPNNEKSLSHSSVRNVYQDSKNRIWIGTDGGGLNLFRPRSRTFTHFKKNDADSLSISSNSVRVIKEDQEGRLWVGTRTGLNLFDPEMHTFKRYLHDDQDSNSISNDFVYSAIYQDKNGYLWIGTYGGGLNRLDIKSGIFKHFLFDPDNLETISDNIVFSIFEEDSGSLWVGTNNGLNKFDPQTGKFQRFGIYDGLPNEVIYGILPGEGDDLWLSTNRGICRFNANTLKVKNFSTKDGLQSNEFNGGAFHRGHSGMLYFGGVYGLNIIDPKLDYVDENKSKMVITSLEILGHEVITLPDTSGSNSINKIIKKGEQYFLQKNISFTDEIILNYKYRFFSIGYAALNSPGHDNLRYQYILEGLDNTWNDVGNRNFITFANIDPGKYTLKVRSENADGILGIVTDELTIIVTPPFWKTWWFFLIEIFILITIVGFLYKYLLKLKTNRLLRIQNEKINQANLKLIESENNLKEINVTKDKFFSIIAHDLKNPFSSLLSISQLMTEDYHNLDEEDKEKGIKVVNDSARRIYRLLENLLTWSMTQTDRIIFEPVNFELREVIVENINFHNVLAKEKGVVIDFSIPDKIRSYGDKEMINTVIRNLLSNALKFTPAGKAIKITVTDKSSFWNVSILDEGIGISPENQEKIFRVDTQFKTEGTSGEKGTGLGLIICKEFVERNGGRISLISDDGKGSKFSFSIPKAI